jgi:hypothetical protein
MTAPYDIAEVIRIYQGSDGDATKALYQHLDTTYGDRGVLAVNLMRACKNSERAKEYRTGSSTRAAYDTKGWALDNLCAVLARLVTAHTPLLTDGGAPVKWGWGVDDKQPAHPHVLYIELPTGQVSFHSGVRGEGPIYLDAWDGMEGQSADRILRFIGRLLREPAGRPS